MPKALVVPVEGSIEELQLPESDNKALDQMQEAVGGHIEGVPMPPGLDPKRLNFALIGEDAKTQGKPLNPRATALMQPGEWLAADDYIAGTLVIVGRGPSGETTDVSPDTERIVRRLGALLAT